MSKTIKCRVRMPAGEDRETYKLKPGESTFTDKRGTVYNAPNFDKKEVLELDHWLLGKRREAFYRKDEKNAIPLDRDIPWIASKVSQADYDLLVAVTRQALREEGNLDMRTNAALGGIGLVVLMLIAHFLMG